MGAFASTLKRCFVVKKSKLKLQNKRVRRRNFRTTKKPHSHSATSRNRVEPSNITDLSYTNPVFQGNNESDPDVLINSEGEDEFYSVQDDASQPGSLSNVVTPRFSSTVMCGNGIDSFGSDDPQNEEKPSAHNEAEDSGKNETGTLQVCGCLSNALLPCLACDECLEAKRKLSIQGGPSTRKKLSLVPSSKWREGNDQRPVLSPVEIIRQRPIAGSQIICSPLENKIAESWSHIEPCTFNVRGQNYSRGKKKEFAPNCAAYIPFGADVFLSPCKIDHIARFVELPTVDSPGETPPILVVNLQIPLYPTTIFQSEYDGAGMSFVFYFKLSENYSSLLPVHFQENFRRIVANETERIKGFPMDTTTPYRERLKILGRVMNFEDLQLSAAERKLMQAYNEKPVLSRPQHEFYAGENYFEIDLDIHRFSYLARKGFELFHDRIKHCIFDFGLTIQGNKAEDLPECMLCCLRLKEIDYTKYSQLTI